MTTIRCVAQVAASATIQNDISVAVIASQNERARARSSYHTSKDRTNKCWRFNSMRRTLISDFCFSFFFRIETFDRPKRSTIIIFGFSYGDGGGGGSDATMPLNVIVNHSKNFASLRGILFMH